MHDGAAAPATPQHETPLPSLPCDLVALKSKLAAASGWLDVRHHLVVN